MNGHEELRHRALRVGRRTREYTPVRIDTEFDAFPGYFGPIAGAVLLFQYGKKRAGLMPRRRVDGLTVSLQIDEQRFLVISNVTARKQKGIPVSCNSPCFKATL